MNGEQKLAKQTIGGVAWKFFEKIGTQGMQLIIQIVLARLLLPEEYGLVGLLTIFITISDVFTQQGLTTALIQKKDADNADFSSVFFANIVTSAFLYAILFLLAPLIAIFYKEPKLTDIMRVLSLNVIIGAVPAVHNTILSRNLDFKKSFLRNIANIVTQGGVGITLAAHGYGAWAMVYSKVAGVLVGAVVLCMTVKWTPQRVFSGQRIKELFSYSSKILGANLLNTVFNNIHSLIIGRYYTTTDLGYYQRGQQIPQTVMTSFDGSITEVLYPAFSKLQNDIDLLKKALRRSIKTSMFITLPVLFGLLATATPLTLIFLTEKWLPSVPFMQLACIVCMFWPLSHRSHALNALGKSNVSLKLSLIGKGITVIFIIGCLRFGIYAIMLGSICASVVSVGITSYYVDKYIHYSLKELAMDILSSLLLAGTMAIIVLSMGLLNINIYLLLALQIIVGIGIYAGGALVFKVETFYYLLDHLKNYLRKFKEHSKTTGVKR